jgi:hypothetical protein
MFGICAGGCNAADGPKGKQGGGIIFCRKHGEIKNFLPAETLRIR